MRILMTLTVLLLPLPAMAGDNEFDCAKNHHDHAVECKAKKDSVSIKSFEINGGACSILEKESKLMNQGDKFTLPVGPDCGYVASVTIKTKSGKTEHFTAM